MVPFLSIPDNMPRMGSRFSRWIGRLVLRLIGWKLLGEIPNKNKIIVAFAPHTSNWDFVIAVFTILALGVKLSFLMKKEAFFWPFKTFFTYIGGIPTNRKSPDGIVDQVVSWYREHDQVWVGIAPEGTRRKVDNWKTGFLRIAYAADVAILPVALDYSSKTIQFCEMARASGDHEADACRLKSYIDTRATGHNPECQ